ncbi:MAG: aliphatic sulfonate ABC transporter substrate-binding protein [Geminicoccaceae bacterium]
MARTLWRQLLWLTGWVLLAMAFAGTLRAADKVETLSLDWAFYNPVSLVLKEKGWIEEEFAADGTEVTWVQSAGSNKAIEFLNARGIDFGSTAGAAALLARINGSKIETVYVFSKPEWTALVTRPDTGIKTVADLKGKRVAVTRGTDPYIFLLRALAANGLSEADITPVLLQHADGRAALEAGQVDAWAGLDPMMAQTELEKGSILFFRNPDANSWGVLNVREDYAAEHPEIIERVIKVYEKGRKWAQENPAELQAILAKAAKLDDKVAARQLERTSFATAAVGAPQEQTIEAAGLALQQSGVIKPDVDVPATVDALLEPSFTAKLQVQ